MTSSSVDAAATTGQDGDFSDSLEAGISVFSFDLLVNSVVAGILLGGFYAAVSLGISMTFGLLEVANIAHPVFVVVGAYAA
jgi:ABC-type branched-subunit amino acid transport system permease subunit